MKLADWFQMRIQNGTPVPVRQFAKRVGVSDGTLRKIMQGGGTRTLTAASIIRETDGLVTLDDLLPETRRRLREHSDAPEDAA